MSSVILTEKKQGIFYITLNRPEKRNALNGESIQRLREIFQAIAVDKTIIAVILRGIGEHFCAGGDIAWMKTMAESAWEENYQDAFALADCLYQLHLLPMPTVALAQGMTLGGGMGLLSACDMVIASREAVFGFPEIHIGLAPSTISPYVVRAIGERAARHYFLTGERFSVVEAKTLGLIHHIVETADLFQAAENWMQGWLKEGPDILREIKGLIQRVRLTEITPALSEMTAKHLATLRAEPKTQAKLQAFLQRK